MSTVRETKVKLTFTYSFIKQMSSESIQQRESEEVGNGRRGALSRLA